MNYDDNDDDNNDARVWCVTTKSELSTVHVPVLP